MLNSVRKSRLFAVTQSFSNTFSHFTGKLRAVSAYGFKHDTSAALAQKHHSNLLCHYFCHSMWFEERQQQPVKTS